MTCPTPGCSEKVRPNRIWCPTCQRLVTDDDWWGLRMASQSPAFGSGGGTYKAGESLLALWGGFIDGRERVWQFDREGNGVPIEGVDRIRRAMHIVEWHMTKDAISAEIAKRKERRQQRAVLGRFRS